MRPIFHKLLFPIRYAQWVAAGKPRRSPEWIAELWDICEPCENYDPTMTTPGGVGGCRLCGCHISPDGEKDLNKLVWPTQKCDADKWPASIVDVPEDTLDP